MKTKKTLEHLWVFTQIYLLGCPLLLFSNVKNYRDAYVQSCFFITKDYKASQTHWLHFRGAKAGINKEKQKQIK